MHICALNGDPGEHLNNAMEEERVLEYVYGYIRVLEHVYGYNTVIHHTISSDLYLCLPNSRPQRPDHQNRRHCVRVRGSYRHCLPGVQVHPQLPRLPQTVLPSAVYSGGGAFPA